MTKTLIKSLALGLALSSVGLVSQDAQAVTFDFVAYAVGNEHGGSSLSFTEGGITVTATGRHISGSPQHFAYLDDQSGGNPAGLAVCKDLGAGECVPGPVTDDDNLGLNEVLELVFNTGVTINRIDFSNGLHVDIYNGNFGVATDQTPTSVAAFTQHLTVPVFLSSIAGTKFSFISNATISGIDNDPTRQVYISRIDVTEGVPEPMTLGLLGLGVAGIASRRRARKAA